MSNKPHLADLYEKTTHGSAEFPVAFYDSHHIITYQWHEEEELILMLDGEADYNINGSIIHLKAGQLAFCQGKSLHSMLFDENQKVHFYALLFRKNYLYQYNDICNQYFGSDTRIQNLFLPTDSAELKVINLVKKLCQLMIYKESGYELEVKHLLQELYVQFYRNHMYVKTDQIQECKDKNSVISTIQFIHHNFSQRISIDDLADAIGYSMPYFERIFKAYTGKSPVAYILLFRLKQAQTLLRSTTDDLLEICSLCGFNNESYFIKKFKEQYGMTPHQYRKTKASTLHS